MIFSSEDKAAMVPNRNKQSNYRGIILFNAKQNSLISAEVNGVDFVGSISRCERIVERQSCWIAKNCPAGREGSTVSCCSVDSIGRQICARDSVPVQNGITARVVTQ